MSVVLKVGHKLYRVEEVEHLEDLGQCLTDETLIQIRENLPEQNYYPTLFHEMMHACWDYVGLKDDREEEIINALDDILYTAVLENVAVLIPDGGRYCIGCTIRRLIP